ncbi:pectinacetylesterase family protein [Myxococcus sp. RHSTA-1-4]|uniref:pectinacetylesterase family protein n=1 Tax=Myxococcus sp. RHSTA-1-4 TaxID=2874601 RepID=UPI001CC0D160|nr:pectinacetylesterase family protein [Myxococcus sp. RHSTA-1-4]MBZ4416246.1 pectinacetylesterase family protein [Myxococcus sp. RHSTA-1-4]
MRKSLLMLLLAAVPLGLAACGDDDPPSNEGPDIDADLGAWTWVDVAGTACGNGEQTGIGVNPTDASTDLYIYLQGGGACWDERTCFTLRTANNLSTGYQAAEFQADTVRSSAMFTRSLATNPFRDMSFVFVPYCTGDVHAGDAVRTYGSKQVHHKGASNVAAWLPRLVATFPAVKRVFLAGSSAGAFGAQLNYERVAAAFPGAEVHVLADSGQMVNPAGTLYGTWLTSWGVAVPPACTGCESDFSRIPASLADTYPGSRFALLAWDQDAVLSTFFAHPAQTYDTLTRELLTSAYDGRGNARYFLKAGTQHTFLGSLDTVTSTTGVALDDWLTQWVEAAPALNNVLEP